MLKRLLLAIVVVILLVGCSAWPRMMARRQEREAERRAEIEPTIPSSPSYIWPPRPAVAERYPTNIQIVDGHVLHPSTGKPVNCDLMGPFEDRVEGYMGPLGVFYPWAWETTTEVGGWTAHLSYGSWLNRAQIRQGIAMSRACRGLPVSAPPAPMATSPNPPAEAPDWCRSANQEWLGAACLTRGNP